MAVRYQFQDETHYVDAGEEWDNIIEGIERKERRAWWKYKRYMKPVSIESMFQAGHDIAVENTNPEAMLIQQEEHNERAEMSRDIIRRAMKFLTFEQKELLQKFFIEKRPVRQIAIEKRVSRKSIYKKINKIKEIFEKCRKRG